MEPKVLPIGDGRRQSVMGNDHLIRLTGADTGGAFTLIDLADPPGIGVPIHVHEREDELFHVIEGAIDFTVSGRTVRAEAGTAVFLPRNVPHAFVTAGPGITRATVTAIPSGIEGMFDELSGLPVGPPDMARVAEICGRYGVRFL